VFTVSTDSAGSHQVTGSPVTTSNTTGTACIDGLTWLTGGTTFYVHESSPRPTTQPTRATPTRRRSS